MIRLPLSAWDDLQSRPIFTMFKGQFLELPGTQPCMHAAQATCFAYGQTGSGKTYTMQPLPLRAAASDTFAFLQVGCCRARYFAVQPVIIEQLVRSHMQLSRLAFIILQSTEVKLTRVLLH